MKDLEKLRVLLPHWIEHNQGHGAEFRQWMDKLEGSAPEISALLGRAAEALRLAEQALDSALAKAGGPLAAPGHAHCNDHGGGHCHHH